MSAPLLQFPLAVPFRQPGPGLIIDNFAGGGGASTGIALGMGRKVDIAINHDESAIAMHEANHPETEHYCQSVWAVDPLEVVKGRPVDLAWFSPDCKHFSKAKGGKPVAKNIRDLAWVVVHWATRLPDHLKPRVIMLENVEEFQTWGPLIETEKGMMPDPEHKGAEFKRWIRELKKAGYTRIQWRELRACDYGAPTIRKRLFLIARCDGQPIVWPQPTHGDPKSKAVKAGKLKPWRTAAECIDWSIPCPSIFERSKPLKDATCRRIAAGIMRYVVNAAKPFIVPLTHHGGDRTADIDAPFNTVTGANRGEMALVSPHITKFRTGSVGHEMDSPMHTVTANSFIKPPGGSQPLAYVEARLETAHVMTMRNSGKPWQACDEPTHTITAEGAHQCLVTAVLDSQYGKSAGADIDAPAPTVTAGGGGKQALVSATMVQTGYGEREGQSPRALDIEAPLGTVVGTGKHAAVSAFLTKHYNTGDAASVENPMLTVLTKEKLSLTTAHFVRTAHGDVDSKGKRRGRGDHGPEEPYPTVTASQDSALVTSNLIKLRGTCADGQPVEEPMPTVTAGGMHVGEVRAFLCKYYGAAEHGQDVNDPLHTATDKARFGLVTVNIEGQEYVIADIGMRMLTPRELARAQGFPDDYELAPVCTYTTDTGGQKTGPLPKTQQIARIGNSVCPVMSEALTRANFPDADREPERNVA